MHRARAARPRGSEGSTTGSDHDQTFSCRRCQFYSSARGHHTPPWRHPPAGMPKQLRQVTDVHGPGGTGKSGVIHVLDLFLKERKFGRMAITAQTGVAGLAAARFLAPTLQKALGLFVCDQISFVSTKFIGLVEKRLRQLTGHLAPFGGVAVVLAADMRQLSPVSAQL